MFILKRAFSRFINHNTSRKSVRKNLHKNVAQYKYNSANNNVMDQNDNNRISRPQRAGGLLNTFYESFIYGCGFFLSNRLLDQIFGPRTYDTYINNHEDHFNNEPTNNYSNDNMNTYSNEHFANNDPTIDDNDFQQDIGLDDDTFDF
ncbi:hypothetical protein PGSY75_0703300 [Plasmodium gaboni]|uniref:Uncharacterized protein n=1 Tax=Plasmodium gaboni TaxID=647221 RepID=A0A151LPR6_9APIC|nr:hypothetical protein PGSY75_0703300 [Plasmodium gaboni]KYO01201.1 hypothetical protein PGSY75_0703300 [Plasmodium gaboni]SOV12737.1 conserved Plasmodium protein, unknown function [Plasmodium gaboni]SOV21837.1 conserved Plasmodium protein, unknown function [Plasmodium sp. DRC-Itaito]